MEQLGRRAQAARQTTESHYGRALVIFDADDTLWFTEPLYDDARSACRTLVESDGFDGEVWEQLERAFDLENVSRLGLSSARFPTSCVEAYRTIAGDRLSQEVAHAIRVAAQSVFTTSAPVAPGVPEVLEKLSREFRLVLLTQGDEAVQERRLNDAGLDFVFSGRFIVPKKTATSFRQVIRGDGRPVRQTWSVGNSLASDINPALRIGMNAIWIPAHVWEHEHREDLHESEFVHKVSSLDDAKDVLLAGN